MVTKWGARTPDCNVRWPGACRVTPLWKGAARPSGRRRTAERPSVDHSRSAQSEPALRILFATGRPFYPDTFGGAERSMRWILDFMSARGHECEGIATHSHPLRLAWFRAERALSFKKVAATADRRAGFRMWRTRPWLLQDVLRLRIRSFRPQVVLTQLGSAGEVVRLALEEGVPPVLFLRDAGDQCFEDADARNPRVNIVANSEYIATWAEQKFGRRPPVVYPCIEAKAFQRPRKPTFVTFINPIEAKGLELALSIAREMPTIPFLFVESWPLSSAARRQLRERLRVLDNVEFWRRRRNVNEVYDVTRLLIVPSLWQEAFGRVIVEAQAHGIPVVGRAVGGIPEAVRNGGLILDTGDDSEGRRRWVAAISSLFANPAQFEALTEAAVTNARVGPWAPDQAGAAVERVLERIAGSAR